MQPITQEDLKRLVSEAKAAGKDVSELEKDSQEAKEMFPTGGEVKEKQTEKGTIVIESTGPAREDDFQDY